MIRLSIICIFLSMFGTSLYAHDYQHPEMSGWYKSLRSGKGPCCDGSEAQHLAVDEWATQEKIAPNGYRALTPDSHYRVRIDGEWLDVDDSAVVDGPNKDPEGRALVWTYFMWENTGRITKIRCFMPGTFS